MQHLVIRMTYDEYGRHDFTLLVEIQEVAVEAKFRFCPKTLNKIFGCSGTLRLHPSPILATFSSFNFLSNLGLSRRDFGAILEGMMPCKDGNCQNIVIHFCPFLGSPRLFRGETLPAAYFLASVRLSLFKISRYNFKFILWAMQKYLKKTSSVQHPTGQANLISNHPFLCLQSLMKKYE